MLTSGKTPAPLSPVVIVGILFFFRHADAMLSQELAIVHHQSAFSVGLVPAESALAIFVGFAVAKSSPSDASPVFTYSVR